MAVHLARRATQLTVQVTMIEAVSPARLSPSLRSLPAGAQVAAGLRHLISMACQLKANVPTCPPLYVALLQILTGLSYCLLIQPKATKHLHLRGGAGSVSVDDPSAVHVYVCVTRRRERKKESRSESGPVHLPVNR